MTQVYSEFLDSATGSADSIDLSDVKKMLSEVTEAPVLENRVWRKFPEREEVISDHYLGATVDYLDRLSDNGVWLSIASEEDIVVEERNEGYLVEIPMLQEQFEEYDDGSLKPDKGNYEPIIVGAIIKEEGVKARTPRDEAQIREPVAH